MTPIRVLLADDQDLIRQGLRAVLAPFDDVTIIGEAADGVAAVAAAQRLQPDVTLMDIRMPRLDGVEATRRLPGHRIIMLTTFALDQYILDALRAGASGFLLKDTPAEEIAHAIRLVAAGQALLSPAVTRRLIDQLSDGLPRKPPPPELDTLTAREREILTMLATGLSNSEIAAQLHIGEGTVKSHVSRTLTKLGLRDRTQAALLAHDIGLA
ncbi:response regulator [Actinoplanes subtropicus]|uniref:response regulator n=1 Tax=Actinoplanes subtropicus TaxID=543632 RepID=UPI0004C2B92E|nr:response regulator transcription factor [Actinoplanes subtropicus]